MKIFKNYPIGKLTTFRVGGKAKYFCKPKNSEEIVHAINLSKKLGLDYYILGGGANLLISDDGISGVVVSSKKLNRYSFEDDNSIRVGSGLSVNKLNKILFKKGYSGLEFSYGLPGSIGGAVFMNARCYSKEFADVIKEVRVINEDLKLETIAKDAINYSYKNSIFMKRSKLFIVDVLFDVKKGDKGEIKRASYKNYLDRKNKGQFKYPSAGCIFKNDYNIGIPSGKIIEDIGLKGHTIGGAEVYKKHANFIINKKNATPNDLYSLIKFVEDEVYKQKGYKLEREVRVIGFKE